jgi:copper transport protein
MWPRGVANLAVTRLTGVAWMLAFVTSLLGICLQGAAGGGVGLGSLFDTSLISSVVETDYGHALVVRATLLVVLLPVLWLLSRRRLLAVDAAAVLIGLGIVATFIYGGHAHSGRWVAPAMVTDVLHVSAAGVWFGGLCALAVTFATAKVEDSRFALSRYIMVAASAIALVVLSGILQSLRQVGTLSALIHTGYGRLLMVKVALVICILIAANTSRRLAGNRLLAETDAPPASRNARRKARSADRSALSALRKAVSVEIAFAIVVLAVTAALTNTQPARDVTSGKAWAGAPFSAVLPAKPLTLSVAVTPGHTGTNRVTLTPRSRSKQLVRVVDVDGSISQPDAGIAKLSFKFTRQANGSYQGSVNIPLPGIWQLDLSVLRNEFDESRATADLPVGVAENGGVKPTPTTTGLSPTGVARVIKPYRDELLADLAREPQICPGVAGSTECRALLDEMDATAVSLSRTLRASSPVFSIESTMYFTVDSADEFASGIQSYLATGCSAPTSTVPVSTCRPNTQLYRDPGTELERNLRGWDQYLGG